MKDKTKLGIALIAFAGVFPFFLCFVEVVRLICERIF